MTESIVDGRLEDELEELERDLSEIGRDDAWTGNDSDICPVCKNEMTSVHEISGYILPRCEACFPVQATPVWMTMLAMAILVASFTFVVWLTVS